MKRGERELQTVKDVFEALDVGEEVFFELGRTVESSGQFFVATRIKKPEGSMTGVVVNTNEPFPEYVSSRCSYSYNIVLLPQYFSVCKWTLSGYNGNPTCAGTFELIERGYVGFKFHTKFLQGNKLLYFKTEFYEKKLRRWCADHPTSAFAVGYYKAYPEFAMFSNPWGTELEIDIPASTTDGWDYRDGALWRVPSKKDIEEIKRKYASWVRDGKYDGWSTVSVPVETTDLTDLDNPLVEAARRAMYEGRFYHEPTEVKVECLDDKEGAWVRIEEGDLPF